MGEGGVGLHLCGRIYSMTAAWCTYFCDGGAQRGSFVTYSGMWNNLIMFALWKSVSYNGATLVKRKLSIHPIAFLATPPITKDCVVSKSETWRSLVDTRDLMEWMRSSKSHVWLRVIGGLGFKMLLHKRSLKGRDVLRAERFWHLAAITRKGVEGCKRMGEYDNGGLPVIRPGVWEERQWLALCVASVGIHR